MSEERLALAAAAALNDPALIRRVALKAGGAGVRKAAVLRVEDQAVLGKAALGDPETAVRKAAVPRLKDKAVLRQLILGDEPRELYNAAVDSYMAIEDGADHDDVLLKIALSDTYSQAATLRLRDQAALRRVYRESERWDAREAALRQIDDQELMRKTVTEEPFRSRLFEIAYSKLPFGNARVMELLESLEIKSWSDRKAAAEQLQALLGKDEAASELLWGRVATLANAPHSDASPHIDGSYSSGGSGDCTHSDYHRHTDTGIGIAFPAHPGV